MALLVVGATGQSFATENGYRIRDKHHEIYLGDPRKASPEKLKTVLRYPVEKRRLLD